MEEHKIRLRKLISPFLGGCQLTDEQDIFSLDGVSSLFAMQLVLLVEKEFRISLTREDLDFANFRSLDAIAHLIHRKVNGLH